MSQDITDVTTLQACVGKLPGPLDMKVMDHLDDSALRWLQCSSLLFASFGDGSGVGITIGGGAAGFAQAPDRRRLCLPAARLDRPHLAQPGHGFGSLFLVPGLDETLRINGRVQAADNEHIEIAIEECYLHCAKAFMRSAFWQAAPGAAVPATAAAFPAASRFMALATIDREGRADVSPKGDPAGALLRLQDGDLCYADRPGNRRVDSFRNILAQPRIAAIALVPGSSRVLYLSGRARISTDESLRAAFSVGERVPKIVTRIETPELILGDSAALARTQPWPAAAAPTDLDPAAIFAAHVRQSKARGLQAQLARAALKLPGLMEKGLQHDYKNNLY